MPLTAATTTVTVNNSTTLVSTGLVSSALAANTIYRFESVIAFTSASTPSFKLSLVKASGLSDATAEWGEIDTPNSSVPLAFAATDVIGSNTGTRIVGHSGFIIVGSDPGTFRFDFAQNTANATNTVFLAGVIEIYAVEATTLIGKAADETRNSTTTLADDSALVTGTLDTNSVYKVELFLPMVANATPDLKYTLQRSGLSDAALYWDNFVEVGGHSAAAKTFGSVITPTATGSAQVGGAVGFLVTGSDPGSLALQWAQNTSNAADSTVKAGAVLRVVKAA